MKKILLVEDDKALSAVVGDNLTMAGFEVVKAVDGELGISLALSEKPDLILLNLLLPKVSGLTVLRTLRKDDWGKNVPVIILTNLSSPTTISEAVELLGTPEEYLVKTDWKISELVAKVKERLGE